MTKSVRRSKCIPPGSQSTTSPKTKTLALSLAVCLWRQVVGVGVNRLPRNKCPKGKNNIAVDVHLFNAIAPKNSLRIANEKEPQRNHSTRRNRSITRFGNARQPPSWNRQPNKPCSKFALFKIREQFSNSSDTPTGGGHTEMNIAIVWHERTHMRYIQEQYAPSSACFFLAPRSNNNYNPYLRYHTIRS